MKRNIAFSILAIGLFIYSVWSFFDWVKKRENKSWSDNQIELMVDKCITSSKYFSSLDSIRAHDICGCATDKLVDTYTYDEIWELEKQDQESLIKIMTPIVKDCMFPIAYEDKYCVLDSSMFSWSDTTDFWSPDFEDYRRAESILIDAIGKNRNKDWQILNEESISDYYRQYVFYIDNTGDSIVYINAFCDIPTQYDYSNDTVRKVQYDWINNIVSIMDGGDCYWQIWINISKKKYRDFWVNGHA